jgi:adenine deaminase
MQYNRRVEAKRRFLHIHSHEGSTNRLCPQITAEMRKENLMDKHLLAVAGGQEKADLVVTNGQIVNVYTGEIYPGGVAVAGDRIAAIGDVEYTVGDETEIVDAGGQYIVPGFIEGHIHPESSNLSPVRFAEIVLAHGTTSVFTDLHEVGIVAGMPAIDAALEEGRTTPLKWHLVVPSHVPFSVGLETSGARVTSEDIIAALDREDVVGISEIVSLYVAFGEPDLLKSIEATRAARKTLAGHGPDTTGPAWNIYAATGIGNDHEALTADDILLRARNGVYAHLRHNPVVPAMPDLVKAVTETGIDTRRVCLVTDDTDPIALTQDGHLDHLVRMSLSLGVQFVDAIQMVTLNVAESYGMSRDLGGIAPGRYADINITTGPDEFKVLKTIANGKVVAEHGKLVIPVDLPEHDPMLMDTFHLKEPVTASDLLIPAEEGAKAAKVHIMRTLPWIPITEPGEAILPVDNGHVGADTSQDLVHIAVVERHHATGNIGKAFIGNFGLKRGAIASTIAHDNHNIVVMGVSPEDMATAVNRAAEIGGGIVIVDDGKVIGEMSLPVLGLMCDDDAATAAERRKAMIAKSQEMGITVPDPFMFLSFITLVAIPAMAVTDKGYVDVMTQQLVNPVLEWQK